MIPVRHPLGIGLRVEPPRSPPRKLRVVRTIELTPRLRRITLAGAELSGFPVGAEGAHLKIFLRRPGQSELVLPTLGPKGPVWPPPALRPLTRTYSLSRFDAERQELSIDFVLHGDAGPASAWAARAEPGDELGIAGPGGPNPLLGPADYYLLAGDLSALPAISALLAMMPRDTQGHVLLEVPSSDDVLPLRAPHRLDVCWRFRSAGEPSSLLERVRRLRLPPGRTFAFLAGEGGAVVSVRDYLMGERGFAKSQLYATPYWRERQTEEQYHEERHRIMDELLDPRAGAGAH